MYIPLICHEKKTVLQRKVMSKYGFVKWLTHVPIMCNVDIRLNSK